MIRRLALAAVLGVLAFPAFAQQPTNPDFRVTNRGQQAINEIYVPSSADANWGQDRLGANILPPGQSFMVVLPAGQCMNDVRVIWADGRNQEQRQMNTCTMTDMNFP